MTTTEFAEAIGATNPTVSRYETGKLRPSRSMLLLLYAFAETAEERRPIVDALGGVPDQVKSSQEQFQRDLAVAQAEVAKVLREERSAPETRRWMLGLALQIGRQREIPLWLPTIMSLWNRYRNNVRMACTISALGDRMVDAIREEEIREELSTPTHEEQQKMRVMIRCPQTGAAVFTGVTVSGEDFKRGDFREMQVFCPHCHIFHQWEKADAYLENAA